MTDYSEKIDAETWAFIERTNSFYPPDAIGYSIAQQRAVYDRMCRAFHVGYPAGVTAVDSNIPAQGRAIPIRIYRGDNPADTLLLYFHGGGFILGGLESHDDICAELCAGTHTDVVSIDYRLAPEHLHPAAFEDALAAFEWAAARRPRIVLVGDSAGGNLAAAVSHAARRSHCQPVGQILVCPTLGGDMGTGSYVVHAHAPMLTTADVEYYRDIRAGGRDVSGDPTFEPLMDTDFSNLPPTVIITAECDPLSSDGHVYRDRILEAGGRAAWFEETGLVHGYLRGRHTVSRARRSFVRAIEAAICLSEGNWPWAKPVIRPDGDPAGMPLAGSASGFKPSD